MSADSPASESSGSDTPTQQPLASGLTSASARSGAASETTASPPTQSPETKRAKKGLLHEIRYHVARLGVLSLPVRLIIVLSLLAVFVLRFTSLVDFATLLYALVFLSLNVFLLTEIRAAPDNKHIHALEAVEERLKSETKGVLAGFSTCFLQRYAEAPQDIAKKLTKMYSLCLEPLHRMLGSRRRLLWTVLQWAVVCSYISVLAIGVFFVFLYAKENASKLGIIRTVYDQSEIKLSPPEGIAALLPQGPSRVGKTFKEKAFLQASNSLQWVGENVAPKGTKEPLRLVVIKSANQFQRYYKEITARICVADDKAYRVASGVAFLYRNWDDLGTFRQIAFGVHETKEGNDSNRLFLTPDNGEQLLLILRLFEAAEKKGGGYGRSLSDYELTVQVVSEQPEKENKQTSRGTETPATLGFLRERMSTCASN